MPSSSPEDAAARAFRLGLSGKLLLLTLLFVMLAEVFIYVPSVANFRLNWLNDRLSAAYTAALVFETVPPDAAVPEKVAREILKSIRPDSSRQRSMSDAIPSARRCGIQR